MQSMYNIHFHSITIIKQWIMDYLHYYVLQTKGVLCSQCWKITDSLQCHLAQRHTVISYIFTFGIKSRVLQHCLALFSSGASDLRNNLPPSHPFAQNLCILFIIVVRTYTCIYNVINFSVFTCPLGKWDDNFLALQFHLPRASWQVDL